MGRGASVRQVANQVNLHAANSTCTWAALLLLLLVPPVCTQAGRIAEAEGAAALVLHARTADQLYSSPVDWAAVRALVEAVSIPVVGNGDVFEGADALALLRETGCAGARPTEEARR